MLGEIMILSGVCLGVAHISLTHRNKVIKKYEINIDNINKTINNILPNNVPTFYIRNEYDLVDMCNKIKGVISDKSINEIYCHYASKDVYGLAFWSNYHNGIAIIFVNLILEHFTISKAKIKIYDTAFHELCHVLKRSSDEIEVRKFSHRVVSINKKKLLPSLNRIT